MIIAVPFWAVILNTLRRSADKRLRKKALPVSSAEYEDFEKMAKEVSPEKVHGE